jgi:hypothetical protein
MSGEGKLDYLETIIFGLNMKPHNRPRFRTPGAFDKTGFFKKGSEARPGEHIGCFGFLWFNGIAFHNLAPLLFDVCDHRLQDPDTKILFTKILVDKEAGN